MLHCLFNTEVYNRVGSSIDWSVSPMRNGPKDHLETLDFNIFY